MPCSTRCIKAPRNAAVIATRACCGVRGASIETFMVVLRDLIWGECRQWATHARYVQHEDTNFDIHPKTGIARKQKARQRRAFCLGRSPKSGRRDWQPRMDSNHRMPESESGALPLGDGASMRKTGHPAALCIANGRGQAAPRLPTRLRLASAVYRLENC